MTGVYTANLLSVSGCDSIVRLNLNVLLSCNQQFINFTADYYELTYGDNSFNISVMASSGLPITFTKSGTSVNVQNIAAGLYYISIRETGITTVTFNQMGNNYYAPAEATLTILVKPAILTVIANNYTIKAGDALPAIFGCTYDGFVYGEDSTVLTKLPVMSCFVINTDVIGDYPIIANVAEANNYEIEYINGILKIEGRVGRLPNAFTPNQDGINDIFGAGYDLYIFNRWGVCLYKGNKGWDGRNEHGKMFAPGVYYYYAKDANGNEYKGSVTLVKQH
jgi:gliding motility-associated-like protein